MATFGHTARALLFMPLLQIIPCLVAYVMCLCTGRESASREGVVDCLGLYSSACFTCHQAETCSITAACPLMCYSGCHCYLLHFGCHRSLQVLACSL